MLSGFVQMVCKWQNHTGLFAPFFSNRCAGIGLALGGVRVVRSLLFASAAGDWLSYAAAPSLVAFAALLACWFPAHRAAHTAPLDALREEYNLQLRNGRTWGELCPKEKPV